MPRPLTLHLLMLALVAGCASPASGPATRAQGRPTKASLPTAAPGAGQPVGPANPGLPPSPGGSVAGAPDVVLPTRSGLQGSLVSDLGGALAGRVSLPASLIGNNSGGLIGNNSGGLIGDRSSGLVGNNGGRMVGNNGGTVTALGGGWLEPRRLGGARRLLAAEPVAGVTVVVVDAAGHWVPDAEGRPYTAKTDAQGAFTFARTPTGVNLLLQVLGLPAAAGTPTAFLPAVAATTGQAARKVDVDAVSSLTMGYIASKFVKGNQAVLNKLPGDVEADTRRKLAQAAGAELAVSSLAAPEVVASVDALRAKDATLDAQVRYVERLLVAGLSNLGEGLPATEVALASPHRIAVRPDGEVYIVENWAGRVRRIAADGTIHSVAGGQAFGDAGQLRGEGLGDGGAPGEAVFSDPRTLALDAAGNIYMCDTGHHRIRRIDATTRRVTTVAGNRPLDSTAFSFMPLEAAPAPAPGAVARDTAITSPHAIAVDAQGRCVFASREGTFRVEASGTLTALLHAGKVRTPAKLASSPEGEVYAHYGADGFGRLVGDAFTPATDIPAKVFKTDWHLAAGPDGVLYMHGDGALHRFKDGTWSQLMTLEALGARTTGLAATADHVWLSADTAGQVWRYTPTSQALTRVGGVVYDPTRGLRGDELSLNRPGALALDAQGRLLVGDGLNGVVWRRDADGLYRRVAGNGAPPDAALPQAKGPAVEQAIGISTTLLPQPDGGLVICAGNQNHHGLFSIDAAGQLAPVPLPEGVKALQVAPDGKGGYFVSDTMLTPVPTSRLVRVTGDKVEELVPKRTLAAFYGLLARPDGTLYYTDVLASVVYRRAPDGTVSLVAGQSDAAPEFSGDGGPATAAGLQWPMSLAMDAAGHLYLADAHNHRVRRVDAKTGIITTLAGQGGSFFTGSGVDDGLEEPTALAFDAAGTLYIADAGHNQIKQIPADKLPR
ncbi:MAG: hypothetical protein VKS61_00650 [Candidatus Sericytochromatia bacterium]|nr:hypothetical protein [Candidatus Sericytochromatia bacterium]